TTTTTSPSPFITETTRRVVPIGGGGDPIVVLTRNGDIQEEGQSRDKLLIDPVEEETEGDEGEEYIEGEEGDEEDTVDRSATLPPLSPATHRPPVPSSRRPSFPTQSPISSSRSTIPPTPSSSGEGEEWEEILNRGQHLPPATTRKIAIQKITTSTHPSTTPSTTPSAAPSTSIKESTTTSARRPTTRRRTIATTTENWMEPSTTKRVQPQLPDYPSFDGFDLPDASMETTASTRTTEGRTRRPIHARPPPIDSISPLEEAESFVPPPSADYSPFDRFDATLNGIPSISSSHPSLSNDLPDYISFNDVDAIPIQIGHIPQRGSSKSGRPNVSLLPHRRPFDSLLPPSSRSSNRFFGLFLSLVLTIATLPSLLLVVLGTMYYGRGSHPMDRSKLSDMVGVLSVIFALFIFFVVPLLLFYSTIGLLFSHLHHTICPLVQTPSDTLEDVVLVMEGCARVQTPFIRMAQSSLLAALSAFPVALLLLQLSNYFLRMRREHYWTHSDSGLM
ncbi:hypothetical protein PMAYCL1PPCAC_07265, partial [Pristionchus mayeri]